MTLPKKATLLLGALAALLLTACTHTATLPPAAAVAALPEAGPVAIERLPDPAPGRFAAVISRFKDAVADPAESRPVVLMLGSSSFRLWDAQAALPEFKVYNFSFGGSLFPEVNANWERLIPPVEPDFVMVYEGDNDVATGFSSFQAYEDFLETMGRILGRYLEATVIIVPVKPSPNRVAFWPEARKLNAAMEAFAAERPRVRIVRDLPDALLDDSGLPVAGLYSDGVHLNADGYVIWNRHIRALLLAE